MPSWWIPPNITHRTAGHTMPNSTAQCRTAPNTCGDKGKAMAWTGVGEWGSGGRVPAPPLFHPLLSPFDHLWIPGDTTTTTQSLSAVRSQHQAHQDCISNLTLHWQSVCCTSNVRTALAMPHTTLARSHRGHSLVRHPLDHQASFPPRGGGVLCCVVLCAGCVLVCWVGYPCQYQWIPPP